MRQSPLQPIQALPHFAVAADKIETQLGFQEEREQVEQKCRKVSESQVGWLPSVFTLGDPIVVYGEGQSSPGRGQGWADLGGCLMLRSLRVLRRWKVNSTQKAATAMRNRGMRSKRRVKGLRLLLSHW